MCEAEFESGDQDYDSAAGWDPNKDRHRKQLEKAKKDSPRSFAPNPEMLLVRPIQSYITTGRSAGDSDELFGTMWRENELAVMYGKPGTGKSVLAMQIAECIARGKRLRPFNRTKNRRRPSPKRVLYLDFELSREQLSLRYSISRDGKLTDPYEFSDRLFRSELYWDGDIADGYEDFTDMLFENIRDLVDEVEIEVLIIDNISFLTRRSTSSPTVAFAVMERLCELKRNHFLSVLVIAHTPKHPDTKPLADIDLQGSIDIAKLADSMFVIGRSRVGQDHFYVKHVKSRSGIKLNSETNVAVFRIAKRDLGSQLRLASSGSANFLGAEFVEFSTELEHLSFRFKPQQQPPIRKSDPERVRIARKLANNGLSLAKVAAAMGISRTTAHRYIRGRSSVKAAAT